MHLHVPVSENGDPTHVPSRVHCLYVRMAEKRDYCLMWWGNLWRTWHHKWRPTTGKVDENNGRKPCRKQTRKTDRQTSEIETVVQKSVANGATRWESGFVCNQDNSTPGDQTGYCSLCLCNKIDNVSGIQTPKNETYTNTMKITTVKLCYPRKIFFT